VLVQYTVSKTTAVPGGIGVMNPWYRTVRAAAPGEVGTAKCGSSLPEAERTSFGVQPCRGWYTASDGTNVEKKVNLTAKARPRWSTVVHGGPRCSTVFDGGRRWSTVVDLPLPPADDGRSADVSTACRGGGAATVWATAWTVAAQPPQGTPEAG
jgi:hypothetical protein